MIWQIVSYKVCIILMKCYKLNTHIFYFYYTFIMNKNNTYKNKYNKYKKKYINLKNNLHGGAISNESYQYFFDLNFEWFIQLIIQFNTASNNVESGTLFHIKGGASVKFTALKYGKNHLGITNDIDILFINNHYQYIDLISKPENVQKTILQQNKENATQKINEFLQLFREKLPGVWTIEINNNLHTIKYNNNSIFDITFYEKEDMMSDFNDTLFGQAYNIVRTQNGLASTYDPEEYIISLLSKQRTNPSQIENYIFSDISIEQNVAKIGFDTYEQHVKNIPIWQQKAQNPSMLADINGKVNQRIWERYVYQSTPEYIQKIINKLERYRVKIEIINSIIN